MVGKLAKERIFMKNLLFSRSHKKHYTDAVVRMGKNNLGFSLVELIIIIAIMAVLVAIAIPVLTVFIEKSHIANDKQAVSDVMYAINLGGQSMQHEIAQDQIGSSGSLKVPVGIIILGNNGVSVIGSNATNQAALEEMLLDTLGEGYAESLQLKYESWGNAAYASFYSSADEMMDKVEDIGSATLTYLNNLADNTVLGTGTDYADGIVTIKVFGSTLKTISIISRGYSNAEELTYSLSLAISNVDREVFVGKWENLSSEASEGFGITVLPGAVSTQPREYYSAVRAAYSQCFANYVQKHHPDSNREDHVSDITGWGQSGTEMLQAEAGDAAGKIAGALTGAGNMTFPWAVCGETFTNHTDDSNATNDDFVDCQYCADLWAEYSGSAQARADAEAFYDTMVTGANYNSGDANAPYAGIIDWAKNETDTFTSLYDAANESIANNEFSIMITVYQDADGLLYCECNTPGVLDE